jgi:two-component system C4-dicarboxylate transport sensor histidine kinase DctB
MASIAQDLEVGGRLASRGRSGLVLFWCLAIAALLAAAMVAGRLARERAADLAAQRAAQALPLAVASLAASIEKQRLIPMVFARDPEVIALLAAPANRARDLLNAKLADIAREADASVIYLIGPDGRAIAASNADTPQSFVGSDYGFRTYFTRAMAEGSAQQYALGTVSLRPGLYLSHRVDGWKGPLGVVVVKVEFEPLEARWRDSGLTVFVTDPSGVVLITTEPALRFGSAQPVADEAAVRAALQIGDMPMPRVPLVEQGNGRALLAGQAQATASGPVGPSAPGWTLAVFQPTGAALARAAGYAQTTTLLVGGLTALLAVAMLRRRRSRLARQMELAAMNQELERRVAQRTEELNRTNMALEAEIAERESVEERVRHLRDELAQANRLSILGQVSAGVAHEINQPVAAIRAYAETGRRLIDAGHVEDARDNLREIVSVTERIGSITQSLRGFARRGKGDTRAIGVDAALDGALNLLAGRIRDAGVEIARAPRAPTVEVRAGRIRFEQIIVNLLQNALDALRDRPDPKIAIRVAAGPDTVAVTVEDNGPGVSAEMREQMFMPFITTKEKGLGLGLVISADIAREFGGELRLEPEGRGAAFTVELPRAAA